MQKTALTLILMLLGAHLALADLPEPVAQDTALDTASSPNGRTLYGNYCASCHGALEKTRVPNRRASRIASAIRHFGAMANLSHLTAMEIIAISEALASKEIPLAQN